MPQEYGRLDLAREIDIDGGKSKQVVVLRPCAKEMIDVFTEPKRSRQLKKIVTACCRAVNGKDEPVSFAADQLDAADGAELMALVASLTEEADDIDIGDGDGILEPIVYDLRYPIELAPPDGDIVRQIQFMAKRLGDLSEFLDAEGFGAQFYAFMRCCGTLLGTRLPMSDSIVGALDFLDYIVIRDKIMGKLTGSRGRWKRTSTN
jgi:hypothetical protein